MDSWTTCEELANLAVHNHGVDNSGWTITLWNQLDGPDAIVTETNGFDYVLDLISEMELAPAFPAAKHMFLEQRKNSFPPIKKREVSTRVFGVISFTVLDGVIKFTVVYLACAHNSRARAGNRTAGSKNVPAP